MQVIQRRAGLGGGEEERDPLLTSSSSVFGCPRGGRGTTKKKETPFSSAAIAVERGKRGGGQGKAKMIYSPLGRSRELCAVVCTTTVTRRLCEESAFDGFSRDGLENGCISE